MLEQIALCEELAREEDCLAEIEPSQRKSVEIHKKNSEIMVFNRDLYLKKLTPLQFVE